MVSRYLPKSVDFFPVIFKGCVAIGDFCWFIYISSKKKHEHRMQLRSWLLFFMHVCFFIVIFK